MPTQSRCFNLIFTWPCVSILFIDVTRYLIKRSKRGRIIGSWLEVEDSHLDWKDL